MDRRRLNKTLRSAQGHEHPIQKKTLNSSLLNKQLCATITNYIDHKCKTKRLKHKLLKVK